MAFPCLRKLMLLHSAPPALCAVSVIYTEHPVCVTQSHHLLDHRKVNFRLHTQNMSLLKHQNFIALQPSVSYLSCCLCEATKSLGCNSHTFSKDQKIPSFCILGNACHWFSKNLRNKKTKLSSKYASLPLRGKQLLAWNQFWPIKPLDLASLFLDFSKVGTLLSGVRDQACSPALDWQGTEALLQLKSLRGYRITPHSFCCHPLMKTANLAQGAFHRLQNSAWQSCWCCWHLQDHLCNQTHWSSVGIKVHLDFWNHLRVRMHMNSHIMSHWIQFTWI